MIEVGCAAKSCDSRTKVLTLCCKQLLILTVPQKLSIVLWREKTSYCLLSWTFMSLCLRVPFLPGHTHTHTYSPLSGLGYVLPVASSLDPLSPSALQTLRSSLPCSVTFLFLWWHFSQNLSHPSLKPGSHSLLLLIHFSFRWCLNVYKSHTWDSSYFPAPCSVLYFSWI